MAPVDAVAKAITKVTQFERSTTAADIEVNVLTHPLRRGHLMQVCAVEGLE